MAELLCEPGVGSKLGCKLFTSACHHDLDILGFSRGDVGEAELLPQPEGSLRDDEQGQCDSHAAPIIQAPRYLYLYRLQNVDVLLQ